MPTFSIGRNAAALACCTAAALAYAGAAHAQIPLGVGFVTTFEGGVSAVESYNSALATNTLVRFSAGSYEVTFPGLGTAAPSNVQITTVNSDGTPHYCSSDGWFQSGTSEVADVVCFDVSGSPSDSNFALLWQARGAAHTTPGNLAFFWADQPTASSYIPNRSYNYSSNGGLNSVIRSGPGRYQAFFGKMFKSGGNLQVTAYGATPARCQVVDWAPNSGGTSADIACVNAQGQPADTLYTASYTIGTTQTGGAPGLVGAYAFPDQPTRRHYTPTRKYQFNGATSGLLTAETFRNALGQQGNYALEIPNPNDTQFTRFFGMAVAVGSAGEFCNLLEIDVPTGEVDLELACYDSAGRPLDVPYLASAALGE
jgi:hypothetical protein